MTSSLLRAVSACIFLLSFLGLVAVLANRPVAFASNSDARERGATAFQTRGCEKCHAILGVGGDRAPDLALVGNRRTASRIKAQIMQGGHGMPPFGDVLSKDEVKDLVVFLTSCRTETAPGCRQWMKPEAAQ
jgi:mono/diheme cytochrome c family protein